MSKPQALLVALLIVGMWAWALIWFTASIDPWLGNAILLAGFLEMIGQRAEKHRYRKVRVRA